MGKSKNFELGEWIFEINTYDCDKATVLLAELFSIISKPSSKFAEDTKEIFKGSFEMVELLPTILSAAGQIFEGYLKPAEFPAFLRKVLAEVRCKKKGKDGATWVDLKDIHSTVFDGQITNQFVLAKEVLIYNFQGESQRFFESLLGFFGVTKEAKQDSQATSTQKPAMQAM